MKTLSTILLTDSIERQVEEAIDALDSPYSAAADFDVGLLLMDLIRCDPMLIKKGVKVCYNGIKETVCTGV